MLVPEEWAPVRRDIPAPVQTVRGVLALPMMVLLWFFPRTMGVRVAASGWTAAILAHVLGMIIGLGLIMWAEAFFWSNPAGMLPVAWGQPLFEMETTYPTPNMTWSEILRGPFVALATTLHASSGLGMGAIRFLWITIAIEAGMLVLALVLMPFAAAGETRRALFGRCLRLAWWSTSMAALLGIGWLLNPIWRYWLKLDRNWHPSDYIALSLFGLWWLVVLLRSGFRFAGRPVGPAWNSRPPECEGCGYLIARLPLDTNCPECGRSVSQSLPDIRQPPPIARTDERTGTVNSYIKTFRVAINDRDYFKRLSVYRVHSPDRSFFFAQCFIMAVGFALIGRLTAPEGEGWWVMMVTGCIAFALLILTSGAIASSVSLLGRRDVMPAAIVTFHALAFVPIILISTGLILAGSVGVTALVAENSPDLSDGVIVGLVAAGVAGIVVGGWIGGVAVLRFFRAYSQTRRASS